MEIDSEINCFISNEQLENTFWKNGILLNMKSLPLVRQDFFFSNSFWILFSFLSVKFSKSSSESSTLTMVKLLSLYSSSHSFFTWVVALIEVLWVILAVFSGFLIKITALVSISSQNFLKSKTNYLLLFLSEPKSRCSSAVLSTKTSFSLLQSNKDWSF